MSEWVKNFAIISGSGFESCPLGRIHAENDQRGSREGTGDRAWKGFLRFDETDRPKCRDWERRGSIDSKKDFLGRWKDWNYRGRWLW